MTAPAWLTARPIAHRGLHDRAAGVLENSLSAADAAIARGFPIECDVQDTADGEAIVFHDDTLDRLTAERGPVHERRADELTRLSVGGTGDRIPTLSALLDRVAGRVGLVIEIKSRFDGAMGLTRRTCELLQAYSGPIAVKSFDPRVVAEVRRLAPALPRGFLGQASYDHPDWAALDAREKFALANLLCLDEMQPDFLSWRVADLPSATPFLWRRLGGGPVTAWTVRSPEDRGRAAEHADQMVFEGFVPEA
jgi:glycerophosphoryl diester phosphodiesterase